MLDRLMNETRPPNSATPLFKMPKTLPGNSRKVSQQFTLYDYSGSIIRWGTAFAVFHCPAPGTCTEVWKKARVGLLWSLAIAELQSWLVRDVSPPGVIVRMPLGNCHILDEAPEPLPVTALPHEHEALEVNNPPTIPLWRTLIRVFRMTKKDELKFERAVKKRRNQDMLLEEGESDMGSTASNSDASPMRPTQSLPVPVAPPMASPEELWRAHMLQEQEVQEDPRAEWKSGMLPVVLIHGFMGSHHYLEPLARALRGQGRRVIRYDNWGRGFSSAGAGKMDENLFVPQVLGVLDALKLDKVDLVGYSMGGTIAIAFAAAHPERLNSLCLLAPAGMPSCGLIGPKMQLAARVPGVDILLGMLLLRSFFNIKKYGGQWELTTPGAQTHLEKLHKIEKRRLPFEGFRLAQAVGRSIAWFPFGGIGHKAKELGDRVAAGEVELPTCAFFGVKDGLVPFKGLEQLEEYMPHVTSYVFEESGHAFPLERYAETAKEMKRFYSSVYGDGTGEEEEVIEDVDINNINSNINNIGGGGSDAMMQGMMPMQSPCDDEGRDVDPGVPVFGGGTSSPDHESDSPVESDLP
mmetsp:Transcript_83949/g.175599  ORF Transcript_83949/g.175599 Transcript_83949/m.175599 type:complete len:578 (+) Transcript_83949:169-1902(+)|eukprot:CAMPEP_0206432266 /NCGR_PEP_ID=MMETSP0324_2-20121206/7822_1 /ASSEMBLY_ACC=CAM_ASM_000836 /TAXON_ID=2866 /ORGANISM="Crypthecodinium cohnii, Strain Seligo" /LENGTH=577 /DNA_ID=CAMNT_0053898281 /DNA_START=81 /DNA_END=1814 /DNA_ORIENTATION=+